MSEFDISKVLEVLNDKERLILKQNLRLKI